MTYNIKNRDKLLSDLVDGINCIYADAARPNAARHVGLPLMKVTLHGCTGPDDGDYIVYGAEVVLEWLVNDLYFDGDANWAEATSLSVETY